MPRRGMATSQPIVSVGRARTGLMLDEELRVPQEVRAEPRRAMATSQARRTRPPRHQLGECRPVCSLSCCVIRPRTIPFSSGGRACIVDYAQAASAIFVTASNDCLRNSGLTANTHRSVRSVTGCGGGATTAACSRGRARQPMGPTRRLHRLQLRGQRRSGSGPGRRRASAASPCKGGRGVGASPAAGGSPAPSATPTSTIMTRATFRTRTSRRFSG